MKRIGSFLQSIVCVAAVFAVSRGLQADAAELFLEAGGYVKMEVEFAPVVNRWSAETTVADYKGASYYVATANSLGTPGLGLLEYPFQISMPGEYQLQWRSYIAEGDDSRECNDSWGRLVKQNGDTLNPVNAGELDVKDGWYKIFMNKFGGWSWQASNVDGDKKPLYWNLEAGKIYKFQISARSKGHAVDQILLWNRGGSVDYGNTLSGAATATHVNRIEQLALSQTQAEEPVAILSQSPLPGGRLDTPYSFTFSAEGGRAPHTWSITSGSLPDGLSLDGGTGAISGTPTKTGVYGFTARVADAGISIASKTFSVTVYSSAATRFEAEDASIITACSTIDDASASGGAYVDGDNGAIMGWNINAVEGTHHLHFHVSSAGERRSMGVYQDGTKIGVLTAETTLFRTYSVFATLTAGTHVIELRDTENTQELNVDYMDIATITLGNPPPVVSFTEPSGDVEVPFGTAISVAASATDQDGIKRVDLYRNGSLVSSDSTAPYQWNLSNLAIGIHSLMLIAIDNADMMSTSATRRVTIKESMIAANGRVAVVSDGNYRDPDDLCATPISLAILHSEGLANKVVHYSHSCDLEGTGDPTAREAAIQEGCDGTALRWGPFPNVAKFYNCRTEQANTVIDLKNAINASTADDMLYIVEAGEPDIIYFAMEAALQARREHVRVITHSEVNDTTGDFYQLADVEALPGVSESLVMRIPDQNKNLKKKLADWYWARDHQDPRINWLWERGYESQLAKWDYAAIVGNFDCSDAGMVWFWATGDEACTVTKLRTAFENFVNGVGMPPTVDFSLPASDLSGIPFGSPVSVSAIAVDADGIQHVELYVNEAFHSADSTEPYEWTLSSLPLGTNSLVLIATDNSDMMSTSVVRRVVVVNPEEIPPTVSITAPAHGAHVSRNRPLTVDATATDAFGSVAQVTLLLDGLTVGTDSVAPYAWPEVSLLGVAEGAHTLSAIATDNDGLSSTNSIAINVLAAGRVVFKNANYQNEADKTWTMANLNQVNPTVSTGNGNTTGFFSGAGNFEHDESFSIMADAFAGWNTDAAMDAVVAGTFTNYLYGLTNVNVWAISSGELGVDSSVVAGDLKPKVIGNGVAPNEVMVFKVNLNNLASADRIIFKNVTFQLYALEDRTDFLIYRQRTGAVMKQIWDQCLYDDNEVAGHWPLEDGDLIVVGTGKSMGAAIGYRVSTLAFNIEVPDVPDGYDNWAGDHRIADELLGDDDGDGENNLAEFLFGGNPTNALDRSHLPKASAISQGGTNVLHYVHRRLAQVPPGTVYRIEVSDSLVNPVWIDGGSVIVGQGVLDEKGSYLAITNEIPMTTSSTFIRLVVDP